MNRRWHLVLLISVVAVSQRPTRAPGEPDGGSTVTVAHPVAAAVAAGRHERLETPHGAVHVWVPAGYHADGAALVAYVHGYYDDVDSAWSGHRLAEQFALSGLNAVFVACEAPQGLRAPVEWRSLGELIATVERAGIERPLGPVVAIGHSGAYRTLIGWLEEPSLDLVISLDAMYAETEPFRDWVRAAPRHRFVDVTEDTVRWSEELARDLASVTLDRVPADAWPAEALGARSLFVRSQHGHMPIVTGGRVIPLVLRLVPAETLPDAPWALLPGDLPPATKAR